MAIDPQQWLRSPLGQRVLALEHRLVTEALSDVFGWQLLQIGIWGDDRSLICEARTQHQAILARRGSDANLGVRSRPDELSIASDSVDAVLLPHTLEYESEPHRILREVERILIGDGQLIVLGFRPISLWGVRHAFARNGFPPGFERLIGEWRLRDWLKLLGFEVMEGRRYLFTGPWGRASPRFQRSFESAGPYLWPLFAGGYLLRARKRVYALTPVRPSWIRPRNVVGGLVEPTTRNYS